MKIVAIMLRAVLKKRVSRKTPSISRSVSERSVALVNDLGIKKKCTDIKFLSPYSKNFEAFLDGRR